jgi:hypothetical protein
MFDFFRPLSSDSAAPVQWIASAVKDATRKSRLLLWVDAVGGFFVCQEPVVRLGQGVLDSEVDVPLLADVSRHHATIRRDEEGYTIEPLREVWLDGRKIAATASLSHGSLIQLGPALQMRFTRPHPLSATARLDFVSNHRTQPSAAAVLLLADTCVLGASENNHVVCRDWPDDVVLYRQQGQLHCRSAGPLEIDGKSYPRQGPLTPSSRVVGQQFSFSLEAI